MLDDELKLIVVSVTAITLGKLLIKAVQKSHVSTQSFLGPSNITMKE